MKNMLLEAGQTIKCPRCSNEFPLSRGISGQAIRDFENKLEQLTAEQESKIRRDIEAGAKREIAAEKKALQEELFDKTLKIERLIAREVNLVHEKKRLEQGRAEAETELMRKLDEEKTKITDSLSEQFKRKEEKYKKKIENAHKIQEELKRKLDRGSRQLLAETLELDIKEQLQRAFPSDMIEEAKKNECGVHVMQTVMSIAGQACGVILWEAKRTRQWGSQWIPKLKKDRQQKNAELAVLVAASMPNNEKASIALVDGVLVLAPAMVLPAATLLRGQLFEMRRLQAAGGDKGGKMEILYNYLVSPQFGRRIRAVVDSFKKMNDELAAEKKAMTRLWKQREKEIERVTRNMAEMCGELQNIAGMPQLSGIAELGQLPEHREQAE